MKYVFIYIIGHNNLVILPLNLKRSLSKKIQTAALEILTVPYI